MSAACVWRTISNAKIDLFGESHDCDCRQTHPSGPHDGTIYFSLVTYDWVLDQNTKVESPWCWNDWAYKIIKVLSFDAICSNSVGVPDLCVKHSIEISHAATVRACVTAEKPAITNNQPQPPTRLSRTTKIGKWQKQPDHWFILDHPTLSLRLKGSNSNVSSKTTTNITERIFLCRLRWFISAAHDQPESLTWLSRTTKLGNWTKTAWSLVHFDHPALSIWMEWSNFDVSSKMITNITERISFCLSRGWLHSSQFADPWRREKNQTGRIQGSSRPANEWWMYRTSDAMPPSVRAGSLHLTLANHQNSLSEGCLKEYILLAWPWLSLDEWSETTFIGHLLCYLTFAPEIGMQEVCPPECLSIKEGT